MRIKVCGMRNPENIFALAELKPDYLGLIFYPLSKRFVGDLDKSVLDVLPKSIKLTGVFVDESLENVLEITQKFNLSAIQLHGSESVEYCRELKRELTRISPLIEIEIWKAFGISSSFDFETLNSFQNNVDSFLFDTKTVEHGGSGISFDWRVLSKYKLDKPFFLSGGISPENIQEVFNLNHKQLLGVDLNSKFEIEPGLKDIDSLQSAFDIIRK
jgi:phosphoribosylanthranilate isomerase